MSYGKLTDKAILACVCQVVVPEVKNNRSRAVICQLERVIGSRRVTYFTPSGQVSDSLKSRVNANIAALRAFTPVHSPRSVRALTG
jgi:hypothetical protein